MKLPNAPLAEVIFELHWSVQSLKVKGMDIVGFDPFFEEFSKKFTEEMAKQAFSTQEDHASNAAPVPYGIVYRYKKDPKKPFPLNQIGHGIFACNIASEYEWKAFRKIISDGLETTFKSHPGTLGKTPKIVGLELRYLDIFDEALLKHRSVNRFLKESTKIKYEGLDFFQSELFDDFDDTVFVTTRRLKKDPDTKFRMEIGPGRFLREKERPILMSPILMISKVEKKLPEINLGVNQRTIRKNIMEWVDNAYSITSPFFKSVIHDELMTEFNKKELKTAPKKVAKAATKKAASKVAKKPHK
ncbi:MAG: TIGR04255 family protein [Proteobacteria bacterium]|nr:TIGR04255 family protein [Pseudomonadota bacterium]